MSLVVVFSFIACLLISNISFPKTRPTHIFFSTNVSESLYQFDKFPEETDNNDISSWEDTL